MLLHMSLAKRMLFVAAGLFLLIAVACWGYWMFRQYRANQTPIPRDATSVVRIHLDGLIRDIAWNALWHSAAYDRDTTERSSITFSLNKWKQPGIPIPANLFLYQVNHPLSNEFPDVYFGSLAVDNPTGFATWLHDNLGMAISNSDLGTVAYSEQALVIIQPNRALFALSPSKPKADINGLTDVLANMLQQFGGSVAVSKSDFREIIHDNGQVNVRGAHRLSIDFKKGLVTFNGRHNMEYVPEQLESTPNFADSNAVSLWVQGSLMNFLSGRQFDIGGHVLHGDSLLYHYSGYTAVEWKGSVIQQDTIVNFDYDDNFELIETQEIVDKSVPEIYCSVFADTMLIGYLRQQGLLDIPGYTINRDALPLFRLGVTATPDGYVQFHTADGALALPAPSSRNRDILYLRVNFNELHLPDLPTDLVRYVRVADLLELSGQPASADEV
ncbi:MAG TPA: hypothetical protein VNQ55_11960, partial [Parapedobacter sp.]|nr:hypothetical protein [Parapedobacter sp.]